MNQPNITEVSIAIGTKMFARYEDLPNTPSHVLAEFIDNALQSSRDKREALLAVDSTYRLKITIDIEWDFETSKANRFVIRDNAAGIDSAKFVTAFESATIPEDNTGLNEFGMGLKTAACWLGRNWTVKTTALGEDVERTMNFDQAEVIDKELKSEPVESISVDSRSHYTEVIVWNPTKNVPSSRSLNKIISEIASIYRQPLRDNELDIEICGQAVKFTEYEILYAPFSPHQQPQGDPIYWRKEIDFKFGKYSAKGFVGILKDINQDHNGFVLMRRGRVIMGAETGGRYFPKFSGSGGTFRYKRLFGELELDGFDVSFNKNDIQDKENLEALMDIVKSKIHQKEFDLFTQAEDYRLDDTIKKVKKLIKKHDTAPKKVREIIPSVKTKPTPPVIDNITPPELSTDNPQLGIIEGYDDKYNICGETYTLNVKFATNGNDLFWLDTKAEKNNIITCVISSNHPYFVQFEFNDAIVALIKSLAVSKFTARKYGDNSAAQMMDFFNDFIKQTKV